jgi:hypothetical protein
MTEGDKIPQSYWENSRWAAEHATELHKQYENVWVAIADQQVVASGPDPVRVREIAARKTGRSTVEIAVEFIESAGAVYGQDWTLV